MSERDLADGGNGRLHACVPGVLHHAEGQVRTQWGGVAILHRSSLSTEQLTVPSAGSALETVWVQLAGRRQIIVGSIYRPPSGPVAPVIDDLHDQLVYAISKKKPVYILGDTNFDVKQPAKAGSESTVSCSMTSRFIS